MASELDVELEEYEEVVGDLNFSTPSESRSASPYQISTTSFQEPPIKLKLSPPVLLPIRGPILWILML